MRRSTVINHSNEKKSTKRKRSLEDRNSLPKSKKHRHLSPNHVHSSIGKRKSQKQSSKNKSRTSRVSFDLFETENKKNEIFLFFRNHLLVVIPIPPNI
jgi:hypothetical protein